MSNRRWAALVAATAILASACSGTATTPPAATGTPANSVAPPTTAASGTPAASAGPSLPTSVGTGEGELDLVIWPGYAEDGSNDPHYNWVKPFQDATGCKVNAKTADTSDDMYNLMTQNHGLYDGVSASGDASNRLIDAGEVAPVNVNLIPDYVNISPFLQSPAHNTVDGVHYGISLGWGANFLMYNTKDFTTAPTSWASVFDPTQAAAVKGKITDYAGPIYIADAALYLKSAQPALGITDPYELTQPQFDAAVALLKAQQPFVGKYWASYTDEIDNFEAGTSTIGTAWQYQANTITADAKVKIATAVPSEGVTGWADTWMMSAYAKHPNCMYMWMAWALKPDTQVQSAEYFGEAPANPLACPKLDAVYGPYGIKDFCTIYHAQDTAFYNAVAFWKTPSADCGDSRGKTCVDYSKWIDAYTSVKG